MAKLIVLRGITGAGKTTLGRRLGDCLDNCVVLEMDDVKVEQYGATTICEPENDFPAFGRSVKSQLDAGKTVVAIEAFIDRQDVDWFLNAVGWQAHDPRIHWVWLGSAEQVSIVRKAGELSAEIVRGQHRRLIGRYPIIGELILDTTTLTTDQVFERVLVFVKRQ